MSKLRSLASKPFVVMPAVALVAFGGWYAAVGRDSGGGGASNAQADQDWATDEQGIWDAGQRPRPKRHPH